MKNQTNNCYYYEVKDIYAKYPNTYKCGYINAVTENEALAKVLGQYLVTDLADVKIRYYSTWENFTNTNNRLGWE